MAKSSGYIERIAEKELDRKLNSSGCVLVTGPKGCGKSTMCARYASSITALKTNSAISLAQMDPRHALLGERPHLIDEWQKAPDIWNYIKTDLDDDYQFGKYILLGSTKPKRKDRIFHNGAGRIATMVLKPFTLFESGESTGEISLSSFFANQEQAFVSRYENEEKTSLSDIAFYIARGGWPLAIKGKKEYQLDVTRNYFEGLFRIEKESDDFASFLKDKQNDILSLVLKSLARNISSEAKIASMARIIKESGVRKSLDDETFASYKRTLEDLFITYTLPSANFNLRSSVAVRATGVHHFLDTSIAMASLGLGPSDLLNDLHSFGLFFEDMAIRDLSVYGASFGAKLSHYRDSAGREVDAILEARNGDYGAIEIKLTCESNIASAIKSLNAFEKAIIEGGNKPPLFKMVLTSHGASYLKDGVYIIPITMLKD